MVDRVRQSLAVSFSRLGRHNGRSLLVRRRGLCRRRSRVGLTLQPRRVLAIGHHFDAEPHQRVIETAELRALAVVGAGVDRAERELVQNAR